MSATYDNNKNSNYADSDELPHPSEHDRLINHEKNRSGDEPKKTESSSSNYRSNLVKTVLLSLSFLQLGFSICGLGPSLLKLSSNTGEDVEKMGIVFTTRGIGYVLTAISIGLILDKFSFYSDTSIYVPKHPVGLYLLKRMEKVMVVVGIVLMAIGMFVTPLLRSFIVLALVNVIIGVGCGLVDVTSNILLCWIWGDAVNPYMQTLHFCFGVGALIFPLMLQCGDMLFEPTGTMKETRFWNVLSVAYYPSAASMVLVALMIIPFSFEKTSNVRDSSNNSNKHEKSVEDEVIETNSVVDGNCDEGYSTPAPSIGKRLMTCCCNLKFYVVSMDWKQICVCLLTGAALYHPSHVHASGYHRFCHPHLCHVTVCIQEESPVDFNGNRYWPTYGTAPDPDILRQTKRPLTLSAFG